MKFTLFLLLPILVLKVKSQSSKIINPEGCGKRLNDVIPNKIVNCLLTSMHIFCSIFLIIFLGWRPNFKSWRLGLASRHQLYE